MSDPMQIVYSVPVLFWYDAVHLRYAACAYAQLKFVPGIPPVGTTVFFQCVDAKDDPDGDYFESFLVREHRLFVNERQDLEDGCYYKGTPLEPIHCDLENEDDGRKWPDWKGDDSWLLAIGFRRMTDDKKCDRW